MSETVRYEVEGGIATITLNRPESLNSMNPEMLRNCDRHAWERAAIHPELGRQTLATMLRRGVEHVDDHIAQIAELRS
jgi:enoyl-CoA hydratase/carnithine racemase